MGSIKVVTNKFFLNFEQMEQKSEQIILNGEEIYQHHK